MKHGKWKIVLAASESRSRVRQVAVSSHFFIVTMLLALVGLLGFGRLVYLGSSYGAAKVGVFEQQRENKKLLNKMAFLEKDILKESQRMESVVTYENIARTKYGLDLISDDVRKAGVGGLPTKDDLISAYMLDDVVLQSVSLREDVSALLRRGGLQELTFKQMVDNIKSKHSRWEQRPAIWPTFGRLTSTYGYRVHPVIGYRVFHRGIDIANKTWTPVFATANGIVRSANYRNHFGRTVIISHNGGEFTTLYAHLHKYTVSPGQAVKRGQLIGYIGTTGLSTGPHLHYEVHKNDRPVNPLAFILSSDVIVD